MLKKQQKGVTLIELILVIGLISFMTILAFTQKQLEMDQTRARQIGGQLFAYNNAVRNWISDNHEVTPLTMTRIGATWLKPNSCGGSSGNVAGYLPCSFPDSTPTSPMPFSNISLTTEVVRTYSEATGVEIKATTTTTPFTLVNGNVRADLAGLSALTAASGSMTMLTPAPVTTDASFTSDPETGVITIIASNMAARDSWLRTDGGNTMDNNIRFNEDNTAALRQVKGVSRIQNIASQALYIGNASAGTDTYPSSSLIAANEKVVIDANARILGSLRTSGAITSLSGDIRAANGDVIASRNVRAGEDVNAGADVNAGRFVVAGQDVTAKRNAFAQIYYDGDNGSFYLDPDKTSKQNRVATNTIESMDTQGNVGGNTELNLRTNRINYWSNSTSRTDLVGNVGVDNWNVWKNGKYVPMSELLPNFVAKGGWIAANGNRVPKPSCPNGTPKIIVTPQDMPDNVYSSFSDSQFVVLHSNIVAYATDNGTYWTVRVESVEGGGTAIAMTYCLY
ncbi:hypothetical protein P5704_026230 (plasmid) [Pseudomonas sp. FeN3W]|nr:hypothetical protein P5704_026230 [Pseudomonas sp. FeN3W]